MFYVGFYRQLVQVGNLSIGDESHVFFFWKMKPGSGHSHSMNDISLSAMQGTVLKDYITFKFEVFPLCRVGVLEVFCNSRNFPFNDRR